jgi:hypothetical protein
MQVCTVLSRKVWIVDVEEAELDTLGEWSTVAAPCEEAGAVGKGFVAVDDPDDEVKSFASFPVPGLYEDESCAEFPLVGEVLADTVAYCMPWNVDINLMVESTRESNSKNCANEPFAR